MTNENLDVSLDHLEGFDLRAFRNIGPYAQKAAGFAQLLSCLPPDWRTRGWGPVVGLYLSDPARTPPSQQIYLAGCAVPRDTGEVAGLEPWRQRPCHCAIHRHVGPYDQIPDKFRSLYERELRRLRVWPDLAPPFEIYHDDPEHTAPEALRTDLCIPLRL